VSDQRKALVYGLAAVLCWSTVATAFKLSLRHLSPAQLVLYSTGVAWLVLGVSLWLRGRLAALLAYAGVVVIATRGAPLSLEFADGPGVALAWLSTLLWAIYWLLNTRSTLDREIALFVNFSAALAVLLVFCYATGQLVAVPLAGLTGALWVGIFEMTLGFVFWLAAMRLTTSTARIANLIFLAPVLSLVFIALLLGEPILTSTVTGLALILAGLALQQLRRAGDG